MWALLADALPIYPLYALLFDDRGLSAGQISGLFAIWSAVAIVSEVPAGALADRYSRRGALVAAGVLQAAGYVVWILRPDFVGFAAGFVLWGLGGSFVSGALEALLYDALAAEGAEGEFARVYGRVGAAGLIGQIPAAVAATVLFPLGGYALVGWVSVGLCIGAAVMATQLPEAPRHAGDDDGDGAGYIATLVAGAREAARHPRVRLAIIAVAAVEAVDAVEEYFSLLAHDWGIATRYTPLAILAIPLIGAVGSLLGARLVGTSPAALAGWLVASALLFGGAAVIQRPVGVAAVAVFYGLYCMVSVVVDTHLQDRITGTSRATVTSVAGLATELSAFGVYGAWALGGPLMIAAAVALVALALPRLLRS